jgi:hypothetical protein
VNVAVDTQCQRSARLALLALVFVCGVTIALFSAQAPARPYHSATVSPVFSTWDDDYPDGTILFKVKARACPERGGFILPRDHVDVAWFRNRPDECEDRILCKGVLVCAVEMSCGLYSPKRQSDTGIVTLALTLSQGRLLAKASQYRTLELIRIPEKPGE